MACAGVVLPPLSHQSGLDASPDGRPTQLISARSSRRCRPCRPRFPDMRPGANDYPAKCQSLIRCSTSNKVGKNRLDLKAVHSLRATRGASELLAREEGGAVLEQRNTASHGHGSRDALLNT